MAWAAVPRIRFEDKGSGTAVVLLHSGVTDSRSWSGVFEQLAQHHRVIRFDFEGFGRSADPATPRSGLDQLGAVLVSAQIDSAHAHPGEREEDRKLCEPAR